MPEQFTGADVEELESLTELTRLRGWRVLKALLNKHRIYCIEKSHQCLESHEDRKAGEWLARSKEPNKILTLVSGRKNELTKLREDQA